MYGLSAKSFFLSDYSLTRYLKNSTTSLSHHEKSLPTFLLFFHSNATKKFQIFSNTMFVGKMLRVTITMNRLLTVEALAFLVLVIQTTIQITKLVLITRKNKNAEQKYQKQEKNWKIT